MKNRLVNRRGFTLLELLVVVSIIALLASLLFPLFGIMRKNSRTMLAKNTMGNITMAMEQYRQDFNAFPPDDTPTKNGSEMVWYFLCRVLKGDDAGNMHYGPYLHINENQLTDPGGGSNAMKKFLSPIGGEYQYSLLEDPDGKKRTYVLIDPGWDKDIGGTIDPKAGFSVTDQKAAADNIYSDVQVSTYKK